MSNNIRFFDVCNFRPSLKDLQICLLHRLQFQQNYPKTDCLVPNGMPKKFTFEKQMSDEKIAELGENIIFFPINRPAREDQMNGTNELVNSCSESIVSVEGEIEKFIEKLSHIASSFQTHSEQIVLAFNLFWQTWKKIKKHELDAEGTIFCKENCKKMKSLLKGFDSMDDDFCELNMLLRKSSEECAKKLRQAFSMLASWFDEFAKESELRKLTIFELEHKQQEFSRHLSAIDENEFDLQKYSKKLEKLLNGYRKNVLSILAFLWKFCNSPNLDRDATSCGQFVSSAKELIRLVYLMFSTADDQQKVQKEATKQVSALAQIFEFCEIDKQHLMEFDSFLCSTNFFVETENFIKAISRAIDALKLAIDPNTNSVHLKFKTSNQS